MGKCCVFFGHSRCPSKIKEKINKEVLELIEKRGYTEFLVGNHGDFDNYVYEVLKEIKLEYPHIDFKIVLAYIPTKKIYDESYYEQTIYPEDINVPPKFAIIKRNEWMIKKADLIISFVEHSWGGAAKSVETAMKAGKEIISLSDYKIVI